MSSQLNQHQLELISDDLLDTLITEEAEQHFDPTFKTLGRTLSVLGHTNIYAAIEEQVNLLCVRIAEASFTAGHEHGYGMATQDTIESLRGLLA